MTPWPASSNTSNLFPNSVLFEGIINARDLGGIRIGDKTVKSGLLLRTANLYGATPKDLLRLQEEFHLRRIFDFRSQPEAQLQPDVDIPGATYLLLPTLDVSAEQQSGEAMPEEMWVNLEKHIVRLSFMKLFQEKGRALYPSLAFSEFSQLQYATFLNLILETEEGGVLWHCSQGKDRTGMGAALLLAALGADRETIIRDFDRSNDAYRPLVEKLCADVEAAGGGEQEKEVVRAFMGVSVHNFSRTLDMIEERWGSLQQYLQDQMEVGPEECRRLRERYLA